MNQDFLNRDANFEDIQKGVIASNFENTDEILKSEQTLKFEDDIKKGEVDVITSDDLKEEYGDKYYTSSGVSKFEGELDALVKKGEDDFLTEDEYDVLTKGREDVDSLERKAVAFKKGEVDGYVEVFVSPVEDDDDEDDDDED